MAAKKKQNGSLTKGFYARLPAPVYRRLRKLAKLPNPRTDSQPKGLFIRIPAEAHARLRKMALTSPSDAGVVASMRNALCDLIKSEQARKLSVEGRRSMASICTELIMSADVKKS